MTETAATKYRGTRAGNYSTNPSREVVILPEIHHCDKCPSVVVYDREAGYFGSWVHADGGEAGHLVSCRTSCRYCHTENPAAVQFVQANWSDEVRCTRCGGVTGSAIGD